MTQEEFDNLDCGDVIRHVNGADGYVIHANYQGYCSAACVITISNPIEWELVSKSTPQIQHEEKP